MAYKLKWTPIAKEDYASVLLFIEANYGRDKALIFLEKTENILLRILKFPRIYPISNKRKKIRKAIISKQSSLYYTIDDYEIWIIEFIDNRQN